MIIEFYINIKFEKKKENAAGHTTHTGRRANLGARHGPGRRGGELAARWRAAERVAARRRAVEAAGGGEDEGVRAEWRPGRRSQGGTGPGPGWRTSTAAALAGALGGDVDGGGARGR